MSHLTHDIRVKHMVEEWKDSYKRKVILRKDGFILKLYIKAPNFEPPPAPANVKNYLQQFMLKIHLLTKTRWWVKQSNLTMIQREMLGLLC